jgi:hypothetical protein
LGLQGVQIAVHRHQAHREVRGEVIGADEPLGR